MRTKQSNNNLTEAYRDNVDLDYAGLPGSKLDATQRRLLLAVVDEYVGNMDPEVAALQVARLEDAGTDRLHFAWAGSATVGEGHYYRIHGPTLLIEYDNTQNDANHVHSVWRAWPVASG